LELEVRRERPTDVKRQARGPTLNYREEVGSDTALGFSQPDLVHSLA